MPRRTLLISSTLVLGFWRYGSAHYRVARWPVPETFNIVSFGIADVADARNEVIFRLEIESDEFDEDTPEPLMPLFERVECVEAVTA